MPERLFTTNQVAELLGATPREVLEWIRRGWLPCQHLPDGPVRITERGLVHFLKGRGIDIMQLMVSTAVRDGQKGAHRAEARPERTAEAKPVPTEEETADLLAAAHQPPAEPPAEVLTGETEDDRAARAMLNDATAGGTAEAEEGEDRPVPSLDLDAGTFEPLAPEEAEALALAALSAAREQLAPSAARRGEAAEGPAATAAEGQAEAPGAVPATAAPAPPRPQTPPEAPAGPFAESPAADDVVATEPEGAPADAAEQVIQAILADAVARAASHVHLELRAEGPALRLRIDGVVHEKPNFARRLPEGLAPRLAQCLLDRAGLDAGNISRGQAGWFVRDIEGRAVRFRLSAFPTAAGPRLVVAVHDRDVPPPDLSQLALDDSARRRLEQVLAAPGGGLVIVAGTVPRATAWAVRALAAAACQPPRNALVLDTPDQPEVPTACAAPVQPLDGWGFAEAARAALDQDADTLVIAQLRDPPTAAAAMEAALAGSNVVAGLRSPDVPQALEELAAMGLAPWPLASTVKAVLAFRMVRRLCAACRRAVQTPPELPIALADVRPQLGGTLFEPVGCERCGGSGYAGPATMTSLLILDQRVVRAIREGCSGEALALACRQAGAKSARELAAELLRAGATSLPEISAVL